MSVTRLDIDTMRALANAWRTSARDDLSSPFLAGLPTLLDAWHTDAQALDGDARDTTVAAKRAEARALDSAHDAALGAVFHYLTGVAALHPNGAALLEIRDRLMPDGLRMKNRSYQAQGTAVQAAKAVLDDPARATLASAAAPGVDLVAAVERWIELGTRLRDLDAERAAIEGGAEAQLAPLRRRWLRIVKAMRMGADLADLDAEARGRLFAKLDEAIDATR